MSTYNYVESDSKGTFMSDEVRIFPWAAGTMALFLAACGGASTTGDDGTTGGGGPAPGGPIFPNALAPTQAERAEMFDFAREIMPLFETGNRQGLALPPRGSGEYNGLMLARMGPGEEFINGILDLSVNFETGDGNGTVRNLAVSGAGITNRLLNSSGILDVAVTGATDQSFGGTITGTVGECRNCVAFDSFTLDTTIDGRFVGTAPVPGFVGTVSGTVTSNAGIRPLDGIIVSEEGVAPRF